MIARVRAAWTRASERIDALTVRERAIAFVVSLVVLVYGWHVLLYAPLDARRTTLEAEVESLRGSIATLNSQTDALVKLRVEDPDTANRTRLAALRARSDATRRALVDVAEHMVPPGEMARVLEAVLTRETGLRLLSLESLGAETVATTAALEADEASIDAAAVTGTIALAGTDAPLTLFRHGLEVRFEGGYLDTLRYLRALEDLSWRFVWDTVTLEVTEHPTAEVAITVYSLSLDESWMDV